MKNLQISDNDLIGNRFNGHDLHLYLRQRNIVSDQLVRTKRSDDPDTYVVGDDVDVRESCNKMIQRVEKRYGTHSLHYPFSFSIFSNPLFLEADIVHYHLIHNYFFNLSLLPSLTAMKPSILSIHEPFFTTGHCIYPLDCERWKTGCGDCPYVDLNFALDQDASALNWEIKRDIFARSQLDLIVYSKYMLDWVKQSPILCDLDAHLIPFGLDLTRFFPADAGAARKRWGIPPENVVLCFRADLSAFKGLEYIERALQRLSVNVPVTLLSVGLKNLLKAFRGKFQIIDMEWLTDDDVMLDVYRAADIFLMPSKAESFGMMAMEAMACGKPAIVFEGTSLPDVVFAPEGGIAVPQGDVAAFTHEIEQLILNPEKRLKLGVQARKLVEEHYDKDDYVAKMIELYREVIDKRAVSDRSKYIVGQMKKVAARAAPRPMETAAESREKNTGSAPTPPPPAFDPCSELVHFIPALYYKLYYRASKQRYLRHLADTVVKPAIRLSWRAWRKIKGLVRRLQF